MTVAKADKDDLQTTLDFLNACETALEKQKFSFNNPQDNWEDFDDGDEDKILILQLKKRVAKEERIALEDVDNRIVMYEFLQEKFNAASCNWRRVYYAADILIQNCCDPTEDHLAFYPGFELFHVAAEQ